MMPFDRMILDTVFDSTKHTPDPNRGFTDEQVDKLHALEKFAEQIGHRIIAVRSDFEGYCPEGYLFAPDHFNPEKYGTSKINVDAIYDDFNVRLWVDKEGNHVPVDTTIAESGYWGFDMPLSDKEIYSLCEPIDMIEVKSRDWEQSMAGTEFGQVYELIKNCGDGVHDSDPFWWTLIWFEKTKFSVQQIEKWIAVGCMEYGMVEELVNKTSTPDGLLAFLGEQKRKIDGLTDLTEKLQLMEQVKNEEANRLDEKIRKGDHAGADAMEKAYNSLNDFKLLCNAQGQVEAVQTVQRLITELTDIE